MQACAELGMRSGAEFGQIQLKRTRMVMSVEALDNLREKGTWRSDSRGEHR